jgi:hypothetical protein
MFEVKAVFDSETMDYIEENLGDSVVGIEFTADGDSYATVTKRFDYEPMSWEEAVDMFNLSEILDSLIYVTVDEPSRWGWMGNI